MPARMRPIALVMQSVQILLILPTKQWTTLRSMVTSLSASLSVLTTLPTGLLAIRVAAFLVVPLEPGAILIANYVSPIATILAFSIRTIHLG